METKNSKENICDICRKDIPTCNADSGTMKYGDGKGNGNAIECHSYEMQGGIKKLVEGVVDEKRDLKCGACKVIMACSHLPGTDACQRRIDNYNEVRKEEIPIDEIKAGKDAIFPIPAQTLTKENWKDMSIFSSVKTLVCDCGEHESFQIARCDTTMAVMCECGKIFMLLE